MVRTAWFVNLTVEAKQDKRLSEDGSEMCLFTLELSRVIVRRLKGKKKGQSKAGRPPRTRGLKRTRPLERFTLGEAGEGRGERETHVLVESWSLLGVCVRACVRACVCVGRCGGGGGGGGHPRDSHFQGLTSVNGSPWDEQEKPRRKRDAYAYRMLVQVPRASSGQGPRCQGAPADHPAHEA